MAERLFDIMADAVQELRDELLECRSKLALAAENSAGDDELIANLREELAQCRQDAARLEWCLPFLTGADNSEADARTLALAAQLVAGKDGRGAIDAAMASPGAGA